MKSRTLLLTASLLSFIIACGTNKSSSSINDGYLTGADNAKLYYRVLGSAQDSIVVLHGGPGAGMYSILPSVKPLAQKHTLIFYDQRGGGRSELPADTSKLQSKYFVEDLEAVRKYFNLKKMNIIAHSFGSILLAEYATKYPNRIKRVIFHGATGPRRSSMAKLFRAKAAVDRTPDTTLTKRASELLQKLMDGTASNPKETCLAYEKVGRKLAALKGKKTNYKGTTCNASPEAIRYYYSKTAQLTPQSFGNWDYTTSLQQVEAPMLVVYGKRDSLAIPTQREWVDAIPHSRLLLVPDAGKAAFSDNPNFTFLAVGTFLTGDWPEKVQPSSQ